MSRHISDMTYTYSKKTHIQGLIVFSIKLDWINKSTALIKAYIVDQVNTITQEKTT